MKQNVTKEVADYSWGQTLGYNQFIAPVILGLITVVAYYKSLFYGFIFDDLPTIIHYFHVRVFDPIGQFFSNSRWISRVLNQFTYNYWQENPFAYRIVNLGMHLTTGVLVFFVFFRLLSGLNEKTALQAFLKQQAYLVALVTMGLFLLHPVQTQTVTYITQMRLEGLAMLFMMGVIALFIKHVTQVTTSSSRGSVSLIFSYVLTAFAAGTKECIVVLPLLIVLIDWFFIAQGDVAQLKKRLWIHAGYWVVLFGVLAYMGIMRPGYVAHIATTGLKNNRGNLLTPVHGQEISTYLYAISQPKVILHYLTLFFMPWRVCFDYDMKLSESLFSLDAFAGFCALLMLFLGAFYLFRKDKTNYYLFGFLWFMINILPRASIFPSTELVCDYKTYCASLGMMAILALLATRMILFLVERFLPSDQKQENNNSFFMHPRVITQGGALFLSMLCAVATQQRNLVWSSDEAFWFDAVTKAPTKARGFNNYATALWEKGDRNGAIAAFNKAIELDGIYGEPHVNLAFIYQSEENIDKSLEHYRRAMEIGEGHPEMFHNLGTLHFSKNNYEVAAQCFKEALALRPYSGRSLINLGRCYQVMGKHEEALKSYEEALVSDYQDRDLYFLHGSLCYEQQLFERAIPSLERLDKDFFDTSFKLGSCYYAAQEYKKAAECFEKALAQDSSNLMYLYNCAQAWLNSGTNFSRALALFDQCGVDNPELPYVGMQKSKCLFHLGKQHEAYAELERIIKTTDNQFVKKDSELLLQQLTKKS